MRELLLSYTSYSALSLQCSKTCGAGKKKRIVYCGNPSNPSDANRCPGQAPDEYGECNLGECTSKNGNYYNFCFSMVLKSFVLRKILENK